MEEVVEAADYRLYWETKRFFDSEELQSWALDEDFFTSFYDSSSPEGHTTATTAAAAAAAAAPKNVVVERNRRKKLNERFYTLRSLVPDITKMDKASIIKDAINYIQQLQEQVRRMLADISDSAHQYLSVKEHGTATARTCLKRSAESSDHDYYSTRKKRVARSSMQVLQLRVKEMDQGTMTISIVCNKESDTMIMLCRLIESLNLKIINANFTSLSAKLLHTLIIQTEDLDCAHLKEKIENAIAEFNAQQADQTKFC